MAKSYFAQTSFVAGEVSPRLLGRPDTDIYRSGVAKLENMLVRPHGPVERRGGFEHIVKIANKSGCRIFGFQVTPSISYIIAVMPGLIQIVNSTGLKEADNVVLNSSFSSGATNWTAVTAVGGEVAFNQIAGIANMRVGADVGSNSKVRQQVTVTAGSDYWLTVERSDAPSYAPVTIRVGTAAGLSDVAIYTNVDLRRFKQLIHVTTPSVFVEVELAGTGSINSTQVTQVGVYLNTGNVVSFAAPFTLGDLRQIRMEQPPDPSAGTATGYMIHPLYAPLKLSYVVATDTWTFLPVAFISPPAEWTGSNYPGALTFFQGRSWWGGTPGQPETFWASKSGSIEDITIGTLAADAMKLTLSQRGGIRWMLGIKNLLIGTDTGEYIVTSTNTPITPSDKDSQQQSAFGSTTYTKAVAIGNNGAYVTGDQRKLRLMGYRWEESAWVSVDLTFPSEHISLGLIASLNWAQSPENLILMTDMQGNLISCTYEPTLKTSGWQKATSWSFIYDAGVQIIEGRAIIWIARVVFDGVNTNVHIERADPLTFMDSYITQIFTAPVTVVTGLGHLEGQVVQVIVDGALHPTRTVSGGSITLQVAGTKVTVGKQFISTVTLLPIEDSKAQGGVGQSMSAKKSFGKAWARVLQSMLPKIDDERAPDRTPSTPMNTAEPTTSTDVHTISLGWSQRQQLTVKQELPGPLALLSVFGEMDVGTN